MEKPAGATVFASAKRTILFKLKELVDYSPKGSIDEPIARFIPRLNTQPDLVTTSSCSGRIAIYVHSGNNSDGSHEEESHAEVPFSQASSVSTKGAGRWLFVTHTDPVTENDFQQALSQAWPGSSAILKVEPFILHVQCRDVEAARRLMLVAVNAGYRESGITIGNGGKIIVAVRTTSSSLEVPLRVGGRTIVDASYISELVAVANERFCEIAARRAKFIELFDAAYLPPVQQSPKAVVAGSAGSAVVCSGCGSAFVSRNKLFSHLIPNPAVDSDASAAKRICPVAPALAAPAAAIAVAAAPPSALTANSCNGCGASFQSRNKLFAHVATCAPAQAKKRAAAAAAAAAGISVGPADAASPPPRIEAPSLLPRLSPSGSPLLVPSFPLSPADHKAAEEAEAAMRRLLSGANSSSSAGGWPPSSSAAAARRRPPIPSSAPSSPSLQLDWSAVEPSDSAMTDQLSRWGHTATLLAPAASDSDGSCSSIVAVVGGYSCAGVHGRTNSVVLYNIQAKSWHAPVVIGSQVPPPLTRHAAVLMPAWCQLSDSSSSQDCRYQPLLITGGHNGPLRPMGDAWWLLISRAGDGNSSYTAEWRRADVIGSVAPAPRWGHAAVPITVPSVSRDSGSSAGILLFGGRDAHQSYADVWVATFEGACVASNGSSGLLSLRWQQVPVSGPQWRARFYHAAALLPTPPSLSGTGGDAATVATVAVHGGYPSPYLIQKQQQQEKADALLDDPAPSPILSHGFSSNANDASAAGSAIAGTATALLNDLCLLCITRDVSCTGGLHARWVPVPAAPTAVAPHSSHALEPRCSHSMLTLPSAAASTEAAGDGVSARLLVLGGECEDPQHNAAQLLTIEATSATGYRYSIVTASEAAHDTLNYASMRDAKARGGSNAATATPASAGTPCATPTPPVLISPVAGPDSRLPMLLRSSIVLLSPQSPSDGSGSGSNSKHSLLSVGGGAVCFAFGSHASPSFTCDVAVSTSDVTSSAPAASAAVAASAGSVSSSADTSLPHVLAVPPRDAHWVTSALDDVSGRHMGYKAGPVGTPDATGKAIGIALTPATADQLQQAAAAPDVTASSLFSSPQLQRIISSLRSGVMKLTRATLPVFDRLTSSDPGTGGPASMKRLDEALAAFLVQRDVPSPLAQQLLQPGVPGGIPKKIERLGEDLLLLSRDAMTHPAWLLPAPSEDKAVTSSDPDVIRAISAPVWDLICATLRGSRLARREEVDLGATRSSRLTLLKGQYRRGAYELPVTSGGDVVSATSSDDVAVPSFPHHQPSAPPSQPATRAILDEPVPLLSRGAAPSSAAGGPPMVDTRSGGWVIVHENGLVYTFDATRTMFSSGNVSEKARMAKLLLTSSSSVPAVAAGGSTSAASASGIPARYISSSSSSVDGEVVVDMYCGIGYWTLPLLVHAGAGHVHACDWNPDAIRTLRINLAANRVPAIRVTIWPGDNAQLMGSAVEGTADRVILGLIPTSERGWPVAVRCLKPTGGWLHVHMNKADHEIAAWLGELTARLTQLGEEAGRLWTVSVAHLERVKSFAPHVWHVVADVRCVPRE